MLEKIAIQKQQHNFFWCVSIFAGYSSSHICCWIFFTHSINLSTLKKEGKIGQNEYVIFYSRK
jgi:hypothetical protein